MVSKAIGEHLALSSSHDRDTVVAAAKAASALASAHLGREIDSLAKLSEEFNVAHPAFLDAYERLAAAAITPDQRRMTDVITRGVKLVAKAAA